MQRNSKARQGIGILRFSLNRRPFRLSQTRIFVDVPLCCEQQLCLPAQAAHHINKVLRMRQGDTILVFNGAGGCYRAEITGLDKRNVEIRPVEYIGDESEAPLTITLVQGISRGQHMDYTVQKAVELGVARVVPVMTEFSNVHLDRERAQNRINHWRSIIISACEQCGRNRLPEISQPVQLTDWLVRPGPAIKLLLEPTAGQRLREIDAHISNQGMEISILSGPEGGLSEDEIKLAIRNGYRPVSLGPRILRTETAAVAAISACQTLWGDMG